MVKTNHRLTRFLCQIVQLTILQRVSCNKSKIHQQEIKQNTKMWVVRPRLLARSDVASNSMGSKYK